MRERRWSGCSAERRTWCCPIWRPIPPAHRQTDHLRIVGLVETAVDFAVENLKPGGAFVSKAFQGGETAGLLKLLKANFEAVRHVKPKASRAESSELYLVATGFKGR